MSCSYSFINGLEMLNIVGTYEKAEMEEGEVYEVVNIKTLKQSSLAPHIKPEHFSP